jgi:3-oxoacyl-[acyl-carrier protein] reductase
VGPAARGLRERQKVRRRGLLTWVGRVDVLVANAGGSTSRPAPIEEITEDIWHTDIDSNLTATFLTPRASCPA